MNMNLLLKNLLVWLSLLSCSIFSVSAAENGDTQLSQPLPSAPEIVITMTTDMWAPYINPEGESLGSAARIIEMIGIALGYEIEWRYAPYDFAQAMVANNKLQASYPYFYTKQRAEKVLFSEPLFYATSRIYFNRQFLTQTKASEELSELKMGRVSGYSYGEELDQLVGNAKVYASEQQALLALFNNDIELLPMTEGVMNATLSEYFPERLQLIQAIPDISDRSPLYVIAPKTQQGQKLIADINAAIGMLERLQVLGSQQANESVAQQVDMAQLVAGEGYPVILGQLKDDTGKTQYLTLPQGTRVVVIEWSDKIMQPSDNDRLYKNMMDLSRVVVVNGPHIGKELLVRNLHINLL